MLRSKISFQSMGLLVLLSCCSTVSLAASLPKTVLGIRLKRLANIPRGGASRLFTASAADPLVLGTSTTQQGAPTPTKAPQAKQHQIVRSSPPRPFQTAVIDNDRQTIDTVTPTITTSSLERQGSTNLLQKLGLNDPTKVARIAAVSLLIGYSLYSYRAVWMPFLDKETIQRNTLDVLRRLQNPVEGGPNPLLLYAAGLAAWELCGLSTIPVESAAGMVFGWKAAGYSAGGKLIGASLAFVLGRYVLAQQVSSKLQTNQVFQLVNTKNGHPPLATAFLMKFSCFPEVVKNFGSSLLPVIRPWMFLLATVVHGGGFSLLWTWLGVDTATHLEAALPASGSLQGALIVAAFVGVVLTPLLMAWWIKDLKRLADERRAVVVPIEV